MPNVRRVRAATRRSEDRALVVRRTPVGEADIVAQLVTRAGGLLSVSARGARRANSKLGALEPLHELRVVADYAEGKDIGRLVEAVIVKPRTRILADATRIEEASRLLRWARASLAPLAHEATIFDLLGQALDALDAEQPTDAGAITAWAGLSLLAELGYAVVLDRCVVCGIVCPPGAAGLLDPARGGLVCRACGGGPLLVRASTRAAWLAFYEVPPSALDPFDVRLAVEVVDRVIEANLGSPSRRSLR